MTVDLVNTNTNPNPNPDPDSSTGDGLIGHYYADKYLIDLRLTRIDTTINFDWEQGGPPNLPVDKFSIRWKGFIVPDYTELYTFYTRSDDGVRLWVDNKQLINQWIDQPLTTEKKGTIALAAGIRYPIRMDYYKNNGSAAMSLLWSSPQHPKQVIAQSQLYSH